MSTDATAASSTFGQEVAGRRGALVRTAVLSAFAYATLILAPAAVTASYLASPRVAVLVALAGLPGAVVLVARVVHNASQRLDRLARAIKLAGDIDVPAGWATLRDIKDMDGSLVALAAGSQRSAALAEQGALSAREREREADKKIAELFRSRVRAEETVLAALAVQLHDTVAQSVIAARWALEEGEDPSTVLEQLRAAEEELKEVLDKARLPEPGVDVATAVKDLMARLKERDELEVEVESWPDGDVEVETYVAAGLYRFFQEALSNVAKHSGRLRAAVSLKVLSDGLIEARVQDDGSGFSPSGVRPASGRSVGLLAMEDRALAAGGVLTVESAPGGGTCVRFVVPKEGPGPALQPE